MPTISRRACGRIADWCASELIERNSLEQDEADDGPAS